MDNELRRLNASITSMCCLSFSKKYLGYDTGKLEHPYLTEHPDAVQCRTGYRLEIEAETAV